MHLNASRRGLLRGGLAMGGAAVLSVGQRATAQETAKTYILVHGSWHGGWCWTKVAALLRQHGHLVYAPTLTGLGERGHLMNGLIDLDTHITDIVKVFQYEDLSDVVLVGHSYAGWIISGVAEQVSDRISSIVFLDAYMPTDGQRLLDYSSEDDVKEQMDMRDHGAISRPAIPSSIFGIPEGDQSWVDARLTPQPLGPSFTTIKLSGARDTIPRKTFIRAKEYISPDFDQGYAKCDADPGWQTFELACGHDAMLILPDQLAQILSQA